MKTLQNDTWKKDHKLQPFLHDLLRMNVLERTVPRNREISVKQIYRQVQSSSPHHNIVTPRQLKGALCLNRLPAR